ncbi:hypothetical protein N474_01820 [Pseudoalteromonas luteoviolacea CPMOR-2]|uniref:Uncharacterized protein n=1 Tax=Pseudoalteromonas luteoviolacea DSM 6061 TaxID=1365250 RepID=A0A166WSS2_9GAMM|nr:hypothetical protein N475_15520 [Pseudoalteromonas luteoviolacea DSM 6061]KZN54481.1 hypothetical protein N474_01820 [Pseudoalteromonas luteoviolacea CPMOR-2]MBE0388949.1 hypothetical protein [Pseudoalteromonas luteoviolacea DSM 6061]
MNLKTPAQLLLALKVAPFLKKISIHLKNNSA